MLTIDDYMEELESVKNQLIELYNPNKIILFGSLVKRVIKKNSDIDICIVMDTEDKRRLISEIYIAIESIIPIDIIVYTVKEWEDNIKDKTSFAYNILKYGKLLK